MIKQTASFDWNHARAFFTTAEEGSLSAAAKVLGLTQPTLSRQVAALEEDLGVTLFERVGRSLSLTQSGIELLDHVRTMEEAAGRVTLTASGQSQSIEGQVSITASELMSTYILPPILKKMRDVAPMVEVEIIASNSIQDLTRRDADIAIRHARPDQPDLIAKRVGEVSAHLYASSGFLEEFGRPRSTIELSNADFIGIEHADRLIPSLNAVGLSLTKRNFRLISNSSVVALELVRQGLGIGLIANEVAARCPDLERILPEIEPIVGPIWLATHRELHTSRRIRLVFDFLSDAFREFRRPYG